MSTRTWRRAALLMAALGALLTAGARAQGDEATVTAQLESGLVRFGATVSLHVQVEGAVDAELSGFPKVEGIALEGARGPVVSTQMTLRYGRRHVSKTVTWTFVLRPQRLGDYEIPPIELQVDGRTMRTRPVTLSVAEDMEGKELGHLEVVDPPRLVFEGEPFTIELVFGWDTALGESVNYLNLILPWWGELPGALEVRTGDEPRGANRFTVNLNSRGQVTVEEIAPKELRGRTFRLFRLRRTFVPTRAGTLAFPESHVEFGRLIEGFLRETQKKTYYTPLAAFEVEVRPLPEEGRPFDFSGAVGDVVANAGASQRDVDVGDSIKLTVDWTGRANLEFFQPPDVGRLDAFDGFRVYGTTDRFHGDRRTVVYDLAPVTDGVSEIPGVPLVVFDPELGGYRTVETAPIPIRVRPLEGATGLEAEAAGDEGPALALRDIQVGGSDAPRGPRRGPGEGVLLGTMLALPLVWLGARTAVRRRGDPDSAEARRRRGARRRLARELRDARGAEAQERALLRFLAARTNETAEAWEGRDALGYAGEEGRPALDEARALAALLRELEERRWVGGDAGLEPERVLAVADRLVKGGL